MPMYLQAGLWGLLSGSALVLGAALTYLASLPARVVAAVMAFGSGVLISALSFDLMDEAYRQGGFISTALGFLAGRRSIPRPTSISPGEGRSIASARAISRREPRGRRACHRSRRLARRHPGIGGDRGEPAQRRGREHGRGDRDLPLQRAGRPVECRGHAQGRAFQGLCVRGLGRDRADVGGGGAARQSRVRPMSRPEVIAATTAVAAGAILAMLADTMIPEAFETAHEYAGLITVAGFLAAFILSKASG